MKAIKIIESLRTCKDIDYIKEVESILRKQCEENNTEFIIGIYSNHSSVDRYVLISKKEYESEIKKKTDYPKLNILYYDLDWFKRKINRLKGKNEKRIKELEKENEELKIKYCLSCTASVCSGGGCGGGCSHIGLLPIKDRGRWHKEKIQEYKTKIEEFGNHLYSNLNYDHTLKKFENLFGTKHYYRNNERESDCLHKQGFLSSKWICFLSKVKLDRTVKYKLRKKK